MGRVNRWVLLFCVCAFVAASCRRTPEQRFEIRGKVISVDAGQKQVTLAHEKIEGFMDAMTMPFSVGDDWAIPVLAPGQTVEATLVVKGDRSWIEGLKISKTTEGSGARSSTGSAPTIGARVPDFTLVNQDAAPIRLSRFRGRPLLLTFIYTRCPLPDYCPRTSANFARIHRELQAGPRSDRVPRLLTISFDTEHDTPAVLREYAGRYMKPPRFEEWQFATGSADEIKKIAGYFGLVYVSGVSGVSGVSESGQFNHSLVTALIAPDGKLERVYSGNRWTPDQLLSDLGSR